MSYQAARRGIDLTWESSRSTHRKLRVCMSFGEETAVKRQRSQVCKEEEGDIWACILFFATLWALSRKVGDRCAVCDEASCWRNSSAGAHSPRNRHTEHGSEAALMGTHECSRVWTQQWRREKKWLGMWCVCWIDGNWLLCLDISCTVL